MALRKNKKVSKGTKAKRDSKAITLRNNEFAILVREVSGTIVDVHGMYAFHSDDGKLYRLPGDISFDTEAVGKRCNSYVRDITEECVITLAPNDVLEEDINKSERYIAVDYLPEIEELMYEQKADIFMSLLNKRGINILGGLLLAAVGYYFTCVGFVYEIVPPLVLLLGALIAVCTGILPLLRGITKLNASVLRDRKGNIIDIESGYTSLNGGMRLPRNKDEVGWII